MLTGTPSVLKNLWLQGLNVSLLLLLQWFWRGCIDLEESCGLKDLV